MHLSIVIPAYNEEARLGDMLDAYTGYFLPKYKEEVEFVVVVNGSIDDTERIANGYAAQDERVRVLVEPAVIGKGGAIMMGAAAARGELIGFVDADGSTPPEAFDDLAQHIAAADAIIASRWIPGAVVEPPQPWSRRFASRIFNFLVRALFHVHIRDTQCGAKIIRGDAMRKVLPFLGVTQWAFDVDLLFKLRRMGCRIIERPTVWRDVAGSKLNVPRASVEMFLAICRLRLLYSPFAFVVSAYDKIVVPVLRFLRALCTPGERNKG